MLLFVAISTSVYGARLYGERETGQPITNWLRNDAFVLANGVRWTWGVSGPAGSTPDMWHFDLTLHANQTVETRLVWNENETTLYSRTGISFADSFDLAVPRTSDKWRMDWQVLNPNPTAAAILNFTVFHFSIHYTHRTQGIAVFVGGMILVAVSIVLLVWPVFRLRKART